MPGLNEGFEQGATGTVEGLDYPGESLPGDAFPCHILDTIHVSNELIKTKNKMMSELLISAACNVVQAQMLTFTHTYSSFMLYVVIGGSVAQFSYRLMLHASLIACISWRFG